MRPNEIRIGDTVADSGVGAGTITDFSEAGYPQVNGVSVAWLVRTDGAQFDPWGKHGGSHGPVSSGADHG